MEQEKLLRQSREEMAIQIAKQAAQDADRQMESQQRLQSDPTATRSKQNATSELEEESPEEYVSDIMKQKEQHFQEQINMI